MEWFFRYNIGILLMASVCLLQVDCIVFEINNMDVNRVIYIFESDIKMTCSEPPDINNPQFEILHESRLVQETENLKITKRRQSLEVTISQVQLMDGGKYTCRVRSMGGTGVLATANLTLNVQAGGAHCLYNDSSLNWNEGETKNLSCYYISSAFSDGFQWQVSNSSSSMFPPMSSNLYYKSEYKSILFASIGPLKSSDNGNVYQCVHSTDYQTDLSASCMFGPITVNPIVATTPVIAANTNPSSTGSLSRTESTVHNDLITNTQSTAQVTTVQSSPVTLQGSSSSFNISTTTEEPGPLSMLVPVILAVACAVIVVSCFICLIVICKCRGKNNEKENDSEMMANEVYDPFDGYLKPDVKVLPTEKTTHPMAGTGSKGGVVTEIPSDENNQVGETYDKVDHNKERLHNHRIPPVAAVRSSLFLNDSDYDKLDHTKEKIHGHMKPPMAAARGTLVDKKLSDEKLDVRYDTVTNAAGKVKGKEEPSNNTKFQKADVVYDKVNTNGLERKKGKIVAKMGDTDKANANLDVQELYAKIDKTRSLERSKAKKEDKEDSVLY